MNIINSLKDKKIAILGFGKEGNSSYNFIRKYLPDKFLTIHDQNFIENNDSNSTLICGENYLQNLNDYDIILKTPGISLSNVNYYINLEKISSQTTLFLQYYRNQTIGITGTKGKSTVTSLIHHILKTNNKKTVLAGNIGIPFFDIIEKIDKQTLIVTELSAHQLEFVSHSPHIAVLLNLYQEHLDHFNSFSSYMQAKLNITKYQKETDILVYNQDDEWINKLLTQHNFSRNFYPYSSRIKYNAAITTCRMMGISDINIETALTTFVPLEHRQEFVCEKHGIRFYNDSISTVSEATIYALETLKNVNTLLLGGFDRGIDYHILYEYLDKNPVENIVFMGPSGKRMKTEWESKHDLDFNFILEDDMRQIIFFAIKSTQKEKICLLSPAAASYDQYVNFEERGKMYKQSILQPFSLQKFNSFRIAANCSDFIYVNKEEEFDYLFDNKIFEKPFLILGGGTNVLFTKDFKGTIIHINTKGIKILEQTDKYVEVEVKAGENWEDFIDFCVSNHYYGIENLAGIPGKVGSCPVQNIGAYGTEVKDVIKEVYVREIPTGKSLVFSNEECKFGYRDSIFKEEWKNKAIIISVVFRLSKIENYNITYKALRDELQIFSKITLEIVKDKVIEIRNKKLPDIDKIGSAGSFFKNPIILKEKFEKLQKKHLFLTCFEEDENHVKLAAAQLIEFCGWKGFRERDAGVYLSQPLVLVNYGNATGNEMLSLAEKIRKSVFEKFGMVLECEVQFNKDQF
ncbi:MAG: UDP-N-acetylmuramate dehydrogenase [Lentimicrobiaceae bacterium]|nr:UDP-N-acetylmuramate dehydrogenase [Lentimicrobiaceae bacterium]